MNGCVCFVRQIYSYRTVRNTYNNCSNQQFNISFLMIHSVLIVVNFAIDDDCDMKCLGSVSMSGVYQEDCAFALCVV